MPTLWRCSTGRIDCPGLTARATSNVEQVGPSVRLQACRHLADHARREHLAFAALRVARMDCPASQ